MSSLSAVASYAEATSEAMTLPEVRHREAASEAIALPLACHPEPITREARMGEGSAFSSHALPIQKRV
jgi:hypothetical protein